MLAKMCKALEEKMPSASASEQLQWQKCSQLLEPHSSPEVLAMKTGVTSATPPYPGDCSSIPSSPTFVSFFHFPTLPSLWKVPWSLFSADIFPSVHGLLLLKVYFTPLIGKQNVTSLRSSKVKFWFCSASSSFSLLTLFNCIWSSFGPIRLK